MSPPSSLRLSSCLGEKPSFLLTSIVGAMVFVLKKLSKRQVMKLPLGICWMPEVGGSKSKHCLRSRSRRYTITSTISLQCLLLQVQISNDKQELSCRPEEMITVKMMDIQKQAGGSDCGLFAIAFATALANGKQPGISIYINYSYQSSGPEVYSINMHTGNYLFQQEAMRGHLIKCLEEGSITDFPVKKIRRKGTSVKKEETITLYCTCRMPEMRPMIQCSYCRKWYHILCVQDSVTKAAIENSKIVWTCRLCRQIKLSACHHDHNDFVSIYIAIPRGTCNSFVDYGGVSCMPALEAWSFVQYTTVGVFEFGSGG